MKTKHNLQYCTTESARLKSRTINLNAMNAMNAVSKVSMILTLLCAWTISWAQTPEFSLLERTTGMGIERMLDIKTDPSGNIYVLGNSNMPFSFGNIAVTPFKSPFSLFGMPYLARHSVSGNLDWAMPLGRDSLFIQNTIAADSKGNIYLLMTTSFGGAAGDTMYIGENYYDIRDSNNAYVFLSKIDSTGNVIWGKEIYGSNGASSLSNPSIAVDSKDNVYIGSWFSGSLYFDNHRVDKIGSWDANVLAKADPNGNFLWAKSYGCKDNDGQTLNLVINDQDEIFVSGGFEGDTIFVDGVYALNPTPGGFFNTDDYLCKFDISGTAQWIVREGSPQADAGGWAVPLSGGGVMKISSVASGQYLEIDNRSTTINGPVTLATTYDAQGSMLSYFTIPGAEGLAHAVSDGQDLLLTWNFSTPDIILGANTLQNAGGVSGTEDVAIARLDFQGNFQWSVRLGDTEEDYVNKIAYSDVHGLLLPGSTACSTLILGQDTLVNSGGILTSDSYIASLNTDIGLSDYLPRLSVELFPNPVHDNLRLRFAIEELTGALRISNSAGHTVMTSSFEASNFLDMNIGQLPDGVYILDVQTNKGKGSVTFLKH
jgi:hypothetical protein